MPTLITTTAKRVGAVAVFASIAGLSACSSRPETADIQKELAVAYQCSILELSDIKKTDGAEANGKGYDVAFSHTVSIKGGKEAAAILFAKWSALAALVQEIQIAYEQASLEAGRHFQTGNSGVVSGSAVANDPDVREAAALRQKFKAELKRIQPCENITAVSQLQFMRIAADEAAKSGQKQIPVPIAIKVRGHGRMVKTESGWHFTDIPDFQMEQIVTSDPVTYPRF
ncbi:hypothetical protein P3W85_23585 [Cupriavidus basilensis]|uniref:Lipoprotein n=1 Tax=Cupriavidus basilensis TaxID=68895 RepID=A0ABT6ATJ2_9BURK|nr:hypothetical protein [Cupriavidus basilensis]MDF3835908.1 hypothetical protein [Cupriavidus basilensis]